LHTEIIGRLFQLDDKHSQELPFETREPLWLFALCVSGRALAVEAAKSGYLFERQTTEGQ
jgi:hypothetical protein